MTGTDPYSQQLRAQGAGVDRQALLVSDLRGSAQEGDLAEPVNCGGYGRIRHFDAATSPGWPANPLPAAPAAAALGLAPASRIRAQVFQNAICNWYTFVPFTLLSGNTGAVGVVHRGLSHDCQQLQQVGAQLIGAGWDTFTRQVLARASWRPGDRVIVDGVRHQGTVTTLRALTAPLPLVVVCLDIPATDGITRARQRDGPDTLAPGHDEPHPVEQDLPLVRDLARLVLLSVTATPQALADRVVSYLTSLPVPSRAHRRA